MSNFPQVIQRVIARARAPAQTWLPPRLRLFSRQAPDSIRHILVFCLTCMRGKEGATEGSSSPLLIPHQEVFMKCSRRPSGLQQGILQHSLQPRGPACGPAVEVTAKDWSNERGCLCRNGILLLSSRNNTVQGPPMLLESF